MKRTRWTLRAREKFLARLRKTCNVTEAARFAGFSRSRMYELREEDEDFAKEWDVAEQEAADKLEREAWRRAVEGTNKPVTHQGVITATYKEYSDRLLELLLKAHRPEKFKDRIASEHSGPGGAPIPVKSEGTMSNAELEERITQLLAKRGRAR